MVKRSFTVQCLQGDSIQLLCNFEKEARISEPDIWGWNFKYDEYMEKLKSLNIDSLSNSKIIVAINDGKIVARCDIAIMFTLLDFEKTGYVDWIYTLKKYRGKGIGKEMLKYAERYFKNENVRSYFLFTANNNEAYEFYHRQNILTLSNEEVAKKEIKF